MSKGNEINKGRKGHGLQVIDGVARKPRLRHITGMNHAVKKSVLKIVLDSDFDVTSFLQVARLAGIKGPKGEPQRKVVEILREAFYENGGGPFNNGGMRRAA